MEFGETLVAMTAVLLGCAIVLIPVAGLTARFAIKPLVESWANLREGSAQNDYTRVLERRITTLERQVEILERDSARMLEDAEFKERLQRTV